MNNTLKNQKLPTNFEQKLFSKIKSSLFGKSIFESVMITWLSTLDIFFKLIKELFPPKNRRP